MYYLKNSVLNLLLFTIVQTNAAELCKTPNNEPGECILLKSCPVLLELFKKKTDSSMEFIRNSICGFEGTDSKVCCAFQLNLTNPENKTEEINKNEQKQNNRHLLANKRFCGYQHSDDYDRNMNITTVSEFPWLARIAYRRKTETPDSYKKRYLCLGSLLNNRYVLTAANCVLQPFFIPIEVQLGEYHIANDTDCVTEKSNVEECSDATKWYGIEKIIVHSNYNNINYTNDIALLRLNGEVTYTDYVRPICLPYPGTTLANLGNILTTSGWGFSNPKGDTAIVKKKVLGTLISDDVCKRAYSIAKITEKHICTVPNINSTELSCFGDSGAPVISSHRLQWHQEGIVSFGEGRCGSGIPDVHTRVQQYLDWIEENIEP